MPDITPSTVPSVLKPKSAAASVPRPPVKFVANIEEEATGKAFNVFSIAKIDGTVARIEVEPSKCVDPKKFEQILLDANAKLPAGRNARRQLLREAVNSRPLDLILCAAHVGWRQDGNSFVSHAGAIGCTEGKRAD